MIENMFQTPIYTSATKMLDVCVQRHKVLAQNLANVETPRYRRMDLDTSFERRLNSAIESGDVRRIKRLEPRFEVQKDVSTIRGDGNTVELDEELMHISHNSMNYEFLTQYVSNSYQQINLAIQSK